MNPFDYKDRIKEEQDTRCENRKAGEVAQQVILRIQRTTPAQEQQGHVFFLLSALTKSKRVRSHCRVLT